MILLPVFISLAAAFLFGISTPLNKALLGDTGPFMLAGLLYAGAALFISPKIITSGGLSFLSHMDRANRLRLAGSVVAGGVLGPVLLLFALKGSDASSVSLWLNLELVFTALLGRILFRDYLGKLGITGVMLTLAAGLMVTLNYGGAGIPSAILAAAACFFWALDNHLTAMINDIEPWRSTFVKGVAAGAVNISIGVVSGDALSAPAGIIYALVVGGVCYGGSIVLYITGAQKLGATRSHIIFSSAPFFGFFISAVFLDEKVTLLNISSLAMLAAAVVLISAEQHSHIHVHEAVEHTHSHDHNDMHHDHSHKPGEEGTVHTHTHRHEEISHSHRHWPDMHHRHEH